MAFRLAPFLWFLVSIACKTFAHSVQQLLCKTIKHLFAPWISTRLAEIGNRRKFVYGNTFKNDKKIICDLDECRVDFRPKVV